MTLKLNKGFVIGMFAGLLAVAFLAIWVYQLKPQTAMGGAPQGMRATTASSTNVVLAGNDTLTILATSTSCVSRIFSQPATQVRVLLADSELRPSAGVGFLLTASSSVNGVTNPPTVFDSGTFGCGMVRAFNNSASTTYFTVTEFTDFR